MTNIKEFSIVKERIFEIDVLRAVAILAIIISHLYIIVPIFNTFILKALCATMAIYGLSIFFLLSGYSLMLKGGRFDSLYDVKVFFKKRLMRIYPLYWIALLVVLIVQPSWYSSGYSDLSVIQYIIVIAGMQYIFMNLFSNPGMWFVSAIIIYYLLFPVIIVLSKWISSRFPISYILSGLTIFVLLIALSFVLQMGEKIFTFYWFFTSGIILGKMNVLTKIRRISAISFAIIIGVCLTIVYALKVLLIHDLLDTTIGIVIVWALLGAISLTITIIFLKSFCKRIPGLFRQLIDIMAPSTYSIYLFHIFFLAIVWNMAAPMSDSIATVMVIILGVPLAIVIPFFIQKWVDGFIQFIILKIRPPISKIIN